MAHSTIMGGSTAGRVMNCPGSVELSKKAPKREESEAAARGTALHEVMELLGTEELFRPEEAIGFKASNGIIVTADLVETKIQPAWDALNQIFDDYDVEDYWIEQSVAFAQNPDLFGTVDVLALTSDKRLLVLDYKFGDGVMVGVADNTQLFFYTAAAFNTPDLSRHLQDVSAVTFGIIQPTPVQEHTYALHDYTPEQLGSVEDFTIRVFEAVHEAQKPDAKLCKGSWCRWCPALSFCPTKTGAIAEAKTLDLNQLRDLERAMDLADEIEPWIKEVRNLALDQLKHGLQMSNYKLVDKQARASWIDEEFALNEFRKLKKIKLAEVTDTKLKSPAQVKALCKQKGLDFKRFEELVSRESSGTTIAAVTDKRPESEAAVFARMQMAANH